MIERMVLFGASRDPVFLRSRVAAAAATKAPTTASAEVPGIPVFGPSA